MREHGGSRSDEPDSGAEAQVADLVMQAREGNAQAFNQLVRLYQDGIFRMVFYRTRSRSDTEDITQDVFLKAYRSLSGLRDVDRFRSWLTRIAVNKVRDHYRKKRVMGLFKDISDDDLETRTEGGPGENQDAVDRLMRQEFWRNVGSMIKKLSPMEQEVFLLRFFDQHNIREIAEILRKSESTVKTHLYRSLEKFKREPAIRELLVEEPS